MNTAVLHSEVQAFIDQNLDTDLNALILKGSPFKSVTVQEIAAQIIGKKKAREKLPTWFATANIYYPPKLNLEQSSSEITAKYKTSLVKGQKIIDLTGGFGVDAMAFANSFQEVIYCDTDQELMEIAKHNAVQLGKQNIDFYHTDGLRFLTRKEQRYDCIYIDPSRRGTDEKRVFLLRDCSPNVPQHLSLLFKRSDTLLIKTAPLLDINMGVNELGFVKEVHVVAIKNEVKEVLYLLQKNYTGEIHFKTININNGNARFFDFNLDKREPTYGHPLTYLYEPNAAILKAGAFSEVGTAFGLKKLHKHSHLYTSRDLVDFPGRRFKILAKTPYSEKEIKAYLPDNKANITTRNFPESVSKIRKRTKIRDGGDRYLFFTTDMNGDKMVLICKKT